MRCRAPLVVLALTASAGLSAEGPSFDVVIRGGTVYDAAALYEALGVRPANGGP